MLGFIHGVNNIFNLYFVLIILRIFLTWIPSIDWGKQPFSTLMDVVDLYLNLFKRLPLQLNGLDFSPVVALIALGIIQRIIIFVLAVFV